MNSPTKITAATPDSRLERLNRGLQTLASWCQSRVSATHDVATTLTMLRRKADELREAVNSQPTSSPGETGGEAKPGIAHTPEPSYGDVSKMDSETLLTLTIEKAGCLARWDSKEMHERVGECRTELRKRLNVTLPTESRHAQSQTPMTDAEWQGYIDGCYAPRSRAERLLKFARTLETALAAAKERAEYWENDRKRLFEDWRDQREVIHGLNTTLGQMRIAEDNWLADRDALAEKLRLANDLLTACKAAIVGTIGGTVEGSPTHQGNYLQRLRQLIATENAVKGSVMAAANAIEESLDLRTQLRELSAQLEGAKAFRVQLMNTLHTHSTAEGDILAACASFEKRLAYQSTRLAALQQQVGEVDRLAEAASNILLAVVTERDGIVAAPLSIENTDLTFDHVDELHAALAAYRLARQSDQGEGK